MSERRRTLPHGRVNSLSGDTFPRSTPAASARPAHGPWISPTKTSTTNTQGHGVNKARSRKQTQSSRVSLQVCNTLARFLISATQCIIHGYANCKVCPACSGTLHFSQRDVEALFMFLSFGPSVVLSLFFLKKFQVALRVR